MAFLSLDPDAKYRPFGSTEIELIMCECASKLCISLFFTIFKTLTTLSFPPLIKNYSQALN